MLFIRENFNSTESFDTLDSIIEFTNSAYPLAFNTIQTINFSSHTFGLSVNNEIELNIRFDTNGYSLINITDNGGERLIDDGKYILKIGRLSPIQLLKKSLLILPKNGKTRKQIKRYVKAFSTGYTIENYSKLCAAYPLISWVYYYITDSINSRQYGIRLQHNPDTNTEYKVLIFLRAINNFKVLSDWIQVKKENANDDMSLISIIQEYNKVEEEGKNITLLKRGASIDYFTKTPL